jgi:hypothetical protein
MRGKSPEALILSRGRFMLLLTIAGHWPMASSWIVRWVMVRWFAALCQTLND